MKVLCVFGTRPEAIKLAPVIRELQRQARSHDVQVRVCVTGQHRQMLDQVLKLFNIVPDADLDVMQGDQTPTWVAAAVLSGLEPILLAERPDWVLVQGDTTTVAAAALAAFYARVRVGHVEAGLRTWDKWQPFPEEMNRRVASVLADLHFAPTTRSRDNLRREGVPDEQIVVAGNTVIDALHAILQVPLDPVAESLLRRVGLPIDGPGEVSGPSAGDVGGRRLVLVTAHRRENLGAPLEQICLALQDLAERYDGRVQFVFPVHLNPNVQVTVHRLLGGTRYVMLTPPLDYLPLAHIMKRAHIVLTDSGGLQEEAPSLGKPVLVLRGVTERPEGVEAGGVRLVGTDRNFIVAETARLLDDSAHYRAMATAINPYGDGFASRRIVDSLFRWEGRAGVDWTVGAAKDDPAVTP